jgi:hypothetical protein
MSESIQKTGYTKTGFSRNSFACCSRHFMCEMGKKECFYKDIDPEVPTLCAAYQRENFKKETTIINNQPSSIDLLSISLQTRQTAMKEGTYPEDEDGQLSLF